MSLNFKYDLTFAFLNRISDLFSEIFWGRVFIGQGKGFDFWDKCLPLLFLLFDMVFGLMPKLLNFVKTTGHWVFAGFVNYWMNGVLYKFWQ